MHGLVRDYQVPSGLQLIQLRALSLASCILRTVRAPYVHLCSSRDSHVQAVQGCVYMLVRKYPTHMTTSLAWFTCCPYMDHGCINSPLVVACMRMQKRACCHMDADGGWQFERVATCWARPTYGGRTPGCERLHGCRCIPCRRGPGAAHGRVPPRPDPAASCLTGPPRQGATQSDWRPPHAPASSAGVPSLLHTCSLLIKRQALMIYPCSVLAGR